jgi:hypothetical protein
MTEPEETPEESVLEDIPPDLLEQLQAGAKIVYQDIYKVTCHSFDGEAIKRVDLPKFIMKPTAIRPTASDKSNLLLVFHGEPHLYPQLLNCLMDGTKKITIDIIGEDEDKGCQWVFKEPRIHAIDFGNLAGQREDTREINVEFAFRTLMINGVEFTTP